jgi:hypothetical protein
VAHPSRWSWNYEYHQEVLRELVRVYRLKKETVVAEVGDAIIWAANLLHGGEPILKKGSTRHSQVTHFYFTGCTYFTPCLSNVHMNIYHRPDRSDIRTGEPLRHYYDEIELPYQATR